MNMRTIACWAVYNPKSRRIIHGFRTKKELNSFYSSGIPIGTVLVRMKGNYVPAAQSDVQTKENK